MSRLAIFPSDEEALLRYYQNLRVLVCGGRDFRDARIVWAYLTKLSPVAVIEGGATGADSHAHEWASVNNVPVHQFRADWAKHGKRAGPIRNNLMLQDGQPDLVLAFPGGRGTANMTKLALVNKVTVIEVICPHEPSKQRSGT